ncbi:MAG: c-type cytochrome [Bacteroidota bacterium]
MKIIYLLSIIFFFFSCKNENKEQKHTLNDTSNIEYKKDSIAYNMLKTQCYICHSIDAPSHDNIIAPPLEAVKRRYSMQFKNKEDFINAVTKWTLNPTKENALMRGAVMQFNVMPKQNFKEEDIKKIAAYIFDNKLETPDWFDAHEKEIHSGGNRGMGRGMGKKN